MLDRLPLFAHMPELQNKSRMFAIIISHIFAENCHYLIKGVSTPLFQLHSFGIYKHIFVMQRNNLLPVFEANIIFTFVIWKSIQI